MTSAELDGATQVGGAYAPLGVLTLELAGQGRRAYPLFRRAERIVLGRGAGCDWPIDDVRIPPRLAELEWDCVHLRLTLLVEGAAVLHGRPLAPRTVLKPGERVEGPFLALWLELLLSGEETAMVTLPPAPNLPSEKTAVRVIAAPPAPARAYRPSRNLAEPGEPTLVAAAPLSTLPLADVIGQLNRRNLLAWLARVRERRRAGATARPARRRRWLLALLAPILLGELAWLAYGPREVRPAVSAAVSPPVEAATETPRPAIAKVSELPFDAQLKAAIVAQREGRVDDAIARFSALVPLTDDPTPRFLVWLLQHRDRGRR